jgi:hypothetical protein
MLLAVVVSAVGVALCYAASRHQRWFAKPLPATASRWAALAVSLIALALWSCELGMSVGTAAWIATASLSIILFVAAGAIRRT